MTTTVPLKVDINIRIDPGELESYILSVPRLQAVQVGNTSTHAEYVEYGTGPIRQSVKGSRTLWDNIDEWAQLKMHISDPTERKRFTYMVCKKIATVGLDPHPYFRPALMDNYDRIQYWFDQGKSLYDIGLEIVNTAQLYLDMDNRNYKWDIYHKFFVKVLDSASAEDEEEISPEEMMELASRIWEESTD